VIVADGRNYLTTTREDYDVIISEPSNPWIGGLASLFSTEFFNLARQRLRGGGMMVQWVQGYNLHAADLRMIVNTFRGAFGHVTVWNTVRGDYLLVGTTERAPVDLLRVKERYQHNPRVSADMTRLGLRGWAGPIGYFTLSDQDSARFAWNAGLNTDDRLPLEFSAPRALYADTTEANWELIRSYQTQPMPSVTPDSEPELRQPSTWYVVGMERMERANYADALALFERALQIEPGYPAALTGAGLAQLRLGRPGTALALAEEALGREPRNGDSLYVAGLAAETLNRLREAVAFYERAVAVVPQSREYRAALTRASLAADRSR
jgi:spermidine synthase